LHGFPRNRTSFVGRDTEVAEVADLLTDRQLVTVTGPGGVGKTRLACEVARLVAGRFADGAWLVELAAVHDPAQVPATIAMVLGIQPAAGEPLLEALPAALSRRQLLLVLDNCEHVLGAAAEFCERLLAVADDVTVLATSREPYGMPGEVRYRLPPLGVPKPGGGASAAVALFADRARAADPRVDLAGEAGQQMARLVSRLDGMPLAIELAAARVEALGLKELAARLESSFRLLAGGQRSAHERHRSLEATVRWSYELLEDPERSVFRQLGVFPGPFTLDGAVAVAVAGPLAELAVLRLVDCSLVTPPRTGADGRSRYLMLESLREFALHEVDRAGERTVSEDALARYAVDVAERAAAAMTVRRTERDAVRWLDAEYITAQHALRWCLEHDSATALRLAVAVSPWLGRRGRNRERYELLSAAAGNVDPRNDSWGAVQLEIAKAAEDLNDLAAALAYYTTARELLAAGGPSPALARAMTGRADMLLALGRTDEGTVAARQALDLSRGIGDPEGEAQSLYCMASSASFADKADEALEWARQAARIDPETYASDHARDIQILLAVTLLDTGETAAAREQCATALAAARDVGDWRGEMYSGWIMADIQLRSGDLAGAWTQLGSALRLVRATAIQVLLVGCLSLGVELCGAAERWDEAVTLLTAVRALLRAAGEMWRPSIAQRHDAVLHQAAQALGPERTRTAGDRGAAMSLDTVVDYLLLLTEVGPGDGPGLAGPVGGTAPGDEPAAPELSQLSARERELVTLVARGMTDAQIAGQLFISVSTVRSHLDRIRDKTGSRRRADLTRLALSAGLV
jgi:predicted ATPase/DNA-binding CsgD family transcriptional regulator